MYSRTRWASQISTDRRRLIVSGLPAGTSIIVDDAEHLAGDVIAVTAGHHAVRVVLNGRILAERRSRPAPVIMPGGGSATS